MKSERIYRGDDEFWYFNVRGNLAQGPFGTYQEAETALEHHLRKWQKPFARPSWPKPLRSLKTRKQRSAQIRQA